MCSNAYVLFSDPAKPVRDWKAYLKPEGIMAIDITHEHNFRSGLILERVAAKLGVKFPSNRAWVKSRDSFRQILEKNGYTVEKVVELEKVTGEREIYYRIEEADDQFDYMTRMALSEPIMTSEFKERARSVFRHEFAANAVNGRVEVVDSLYVYIARN